MFRGIKMQSQLILRSILLTMVLHFSYAQSSGVRHNVKVRYYFKQDTVFNEVKLNDLIEIYGIIIDEEANLYIHEEENFIDLSCFNCVLNNIHPDEQVPNSFNERPEK